MSSQRSYFTVPLSLLRVGDNPDETLALCIDVGIVNAGAGYRVTHGAGAFTRLLTEAKEAALKDGLSIEPSDDFAHEVAWDHDMDGVEVWNDALAGWHLLGIKGGDLESVVENWISHRAPGEVFCRIREDWIWNAVRTIAQSDGHAGAGTGGSGGRPLSFREFRLLAALLSAPVNKEGFVFLGWESIQARACGFVRKRDFAAGRQSLPDHCQPLSRKVIRTTLDRMEALGFFIRFRYAVSPRGGRYAYSFRHADRNLLAKSVEVFQIKRKWALLKVKRQRAADLEHSKRIRALALGAMQAG